MEGREPASHLQASGIEVPACDRDLGFQAGFLTKMVLALANAIRLSLIPPVFIAPNGAALTINRKLVAVKCMSSVPEKQLPRIPEFLLYTLCMKVLTPSVSTSFYLRVTPLAH